jgi:hypothetical protein
MAFSIRYDRANALVVVRYSEVVTGTDLVRSIELIVAGEDWRPTDCVVLDWRVVRQVELVPEEVERLRRRSKQLAPFLGPGQTAIIVAREQDEVTAAMLAVRAWRHPGRAREIFRRVSAAAAWLGVPPSLLRSPTAE